MQTDMQIHDGFPEDVIIVMLSRDQSYAQIYVKGHETQAAAWNESQDRFEIDELSVVTGETWPALVRNLGRAWRLLGTARIVENADRGNDTIINL